MVDGDWNTVWYDMDGEKLVHYFLHFLNTNLQTDLVQEFRNLLDKYTPSRPSDLEQRSTRYEEWKQHLGENAKSRVIRLTYHHQQQHSHLSPPGPAADFLGRSRKRTTAAMAFRKSKAMEDLATWISILFATIDPPTWRRYREVYRLTASHIPVLRECDPHQNHCFVSHYLLINILTTPHYNVTDPPKGWVAMVVVGNYTRRNLFIPHLGIAIPYQTGDIVFIRSWMLLHFINEYSGPERYVVVFSTTYSIFEWLQKTF